MFKTFNITRLLLHLTIFIFLVITGCASSKGNSYYARKSKTSKVSASQLGRNKYYFSTGYQKKLKKTFKK